MISLFDDELARSRENSYFYSFGRKSTTRKSGFSDSRKGQKDKQIKDHNRIFKIHWYNLYASWERSFTLCDDTHSRKRGRAIINSLYLLSSKRWKFLSRDPPPRQAHYPSVNKAIREGAFHSESNARKSRRIAAINQVLRQAAHLVARSWTNPNCQKSVSLAKETTTNMLWK